MSARTDFAVFLAVIAATLGVAIAVGPARAAHADEIVVVHEDGPGPYWHRHPPYPYGPPPHHAVVVIEPAPPPVVVEPAPVVVAPATPVATAPQAAAADNGYCREYQSVTVVDSKPVKSYGTACRQPDGSWKIVSQNP